MIYASLGLAVLFGASLAGAILSYFLECQWLPLTWKDWGILAVLFAGGLGACLYLHFRKGKKKAESAMHHELEKFQRECKMAMRGHLKASILFWIHFYRKEKVKTLDDAKKEIFQDLKREFSDVRWMESILEDIRQEIAKYK